MQAGTLEMAVRIASSCSCIFCTNQKDGKNIHTNTHRFSHGELTHAPIPNIWLIFHPSSSTHSNFCPSSYDTKKFTQAANNSFLELNSRIVHRFIKFFIFTHSSFTLCNHRHQYCLKFWHFTQ